ncbi:MAG TPA: GNAT family N-acetyltransferase, partial [Nocardioidaceae bacterium]|nr:GNAT family N-acetyltransferase [Nocardioidaceae bacterium]
MPLLRPVIVDDVHQVLELNHRNVELLAPMDAVRLSELQVLADRCDVVDVDGAFAGFVITFGPGATYDSENYRWFAGRHDDFYYLDRIVLHEDFRRQGLGAFVYDELEQRARTHGRMLLEVNVEPPNEGSLAFHRNRGYEDLAILGDGPKK